MFIYLSKLLPPFLYPPGICTVLLCLALLLRKRTTFAFSLVAATVLIIFLTGTPYLPFYMVRILESRHLSKGELPQADAIVVLGGGTQSPEPPRMYPELSEGGDRVVHAARLYREGKAPLVVASGGSIAFLGGGPGAPDMLSFLTMMGVPEQAVLLESRSRNTFENAVETKKLLSDRRVRRILLVTSAMHMPRSMLVFERAGFEAIPAPTDFTVTDEDWARLFRPSPASFLISAVPSSANMDLFNRALRELLGLAVYRAKGWL